MPMTIPKVFVASSSEGLEVVASVHKLLQNALSGTAEVKPWPGEFQLTRSYMESLERLLDRSDFAVLVLTPDDRTKSRKKEWLSPRDNVVFELGLFFGRLGRERCFLIQRHDLDLKLPSDLLGIEPAKYAMAPGQDIETSLALACNRVSDGIREAIYTLPSRLRLGDGERAAQAAIRWFGDRIVGTWWERIWLAGEAPALSSLSFLTIKLDDIHYSVELHGKAYGPDGIQLATWRSAAARLENKRILYVRECRRYDAKTSAWLPGLGEIDFDESSDGIDQGEGRFWESDESHPEETVIKCVELRRSLDESDRRTMESGSKAERQILVRRVLGNW